MKIHVTGESTSIFIGYVQDVHVTTESTCIIIGPCNDFDESEIYCQHCAILARTVISAVRARNNSQFCDSCKESK